MRSLTAQSADLRKVLIKYVKGLNDRLHVHCSQLHHMNCFNFSSPSGTRGRPPTEAPNWFRMLMPSEVLAPHLEGLDHGRYAIEMPGENKPW